MSGITTHFADSDVHWLLRHSETFAILTAESRAPRNPDANRPSEKLSEKKKFVSAATKFEFQTCAG